MNLGSNIRKYRLLKKLTQHEMGKKLGFAPKAAFTRVSAYENNTVAPKNDIREKIAEILDIDISALSDNDYSSDIEIIRALFTIQEKYGVSLDKSDSGISLVFNSDDNKNDALLAYLYDWYDAANKYKDDAIEYEKWKGRFPQDTQSRWHQIKGECNS